ncbi:MAG TPA: type II secretion system protein [Fimbriimonadaceae bacterium]|nr:type II secretion system protein [Fimbriimonadaceae bacterium]
MARSRGFTMIEALASVALLLVGIVAALGAIGQMTRAEAHLQESERMRRLADRKVAELIGTGDYQYITEGDFTDLGDDRYQFSVTIEPTGVEGLEVVTVLVTRVNRRNDPGYDASQLVYIPPETGGEGAAG